MLIRILLDNVVVPDIVVFPDTVWLPLTVKSAEVKLPLVDKFSEPNEIFPPTELIVAVIKLPAVTEPWRSESPLTKIVPSDVKLAPSILEPTLNEPVITELVPTVNPALNAKFSAPISFIRLMSLFLKPIEPFSSKISASLNVIVPIVEPAASWATDPDFLMYIPSAKVSVNLRFIWVWILSVTPLRWFISAALAEVLVRIFKSSADADNVDNEFNIAIEDFGSASPSTLKVVTSSSPLILLEEALTYIP